MTGAAVIIVWRLYRRKPILPKRTSLSEVAISTWVFGAGLFTLGALASGLANLPSFTMCFSAFALLYLAGMIYCLR